MLHKPKTFLRYMIPFEKELLDKGLEKNGPIVSVSGISGSGKSEVVLHILKKLQAFRRVYAGGVFREMASSKGMSVEEFSRTRPVEVDYGIDKWLFENSITGNTVSEGRTSGWVMGDWADIRILVLCPLKIRANRIALREDEKEKDTIKMLTQRDEQDNKRYKEIYGIDVEKKSIYTHVIENTGSIELLKKNTANAISSLM